MSHAYQQLLRSAIAVVVALSVAMTAVGGTMAQELPDLREPVNAPRDAATMSVPENRIGVQLWTVSGQEFVPFLRIEGGAPPPVPLLLPAIQAPPSDADK